MRVTAGKGLPLLGTSFTMLTCAACQSRLALNAAFCGQCGAPAPREAQPMLTMGGLRTDPGVRDDGVVLREGEIFAGRYTIGGLIGAGGMGSVYRAVERATGETIALKVIRPERLRSPGAMQQLVQEGLVARRIRHDNVVSVYDVSKAEGSGAAYLTMELLEGMTLRAWSRRRIAAGEDCPFGLAAEIVLQICAGLHVAHAQGVIHRDLKPENVFLLGEPKPGAVRLKLLDFGLARAGVDAGGGLGSSGAGTPLYMAPEQKTSPDAVQPSADIYSLAMMFYELLADVLPHGVWHPPSAGRADVPKAADDLISLGVSNRPRSRPQSAEAFAALVQAALPRVAPPRAAPQAPPVQHRPFVASPPAPPAFSSGPLTIASTMPHGVALSDGTQVWFSKYVGQQVQLTFKGAAFQYAMTHAIIEALAMLEDARQDPSLAKPIQAAATPAGDGGKRFAYRWAVAEKLFDEAGIPLAPPGTKLNPFHYGLAREELAKSGELLKELAAKGPFLANLQMITLSPVDMSRKTPMPAKRSTFLSNFLWVGRVGRGGFQARLIVCIATIVFAVVWITGVLGTTRHYDVTELTPSGLLLYIVIMAMLLTAIWVIISTSIRKLHDFNQTGWWMLLIVPMYPFLLIFWIFSFFAKGDVGRNKFGDPMR